MRQTHLPNEGKIIAENKGASAQEVSRILHLVSFPSDASYLIQYFYEKVLTHDAQHMSNNGVGYTVLRVKVVAFYLTPLIN